MKLFKVIMKKKRDQAFWNDANLFVLAADHANAHEKAIRFEAQYGSIDSISLCGDITRSEDVFVLMGRI